MEAREVRLGDFVEVTNCFDAGLRGRVVEVDSYGARIKAWNRTRYAYENKAGQHFIWTQLQLLNVVDAIGAVR